MPRPTFEPARSRAATHMKVAGALLFQALLAAALVATPAVAGAHKGRRVRHVATRHVAGDAGQLLRVQRLSYSPYGAAAYRVLYASTGLDGRPIPVSGIVVVPPGPAPPRGRDIVAWAHPTTGIAPRCAPSLQSDVLYTIPGLQTFLARGDIVTATDYPGLGTPEPHPYLVGVSEGRAVLDSVRAARRVPGAQASTRFALWGHSQGGQAVLFAGQLAAHYAPGLSLVGIAAAAPATHLGVLMKHNIASLSGKTLTAYTLASWSRVYGLSLTRIVAPAAMPTLESIVSQCLQTTGETWAVGLTASWFGQNFLLADPTRIEPWRGLIARNNPGGAPPGGPVFIAQGSSDQLVLPAVTAEFARQLCRRGAKVRFVRMPFVEHMDAGRAAAKAAADWISDRFQGRPPPNDCKGAI